MAAVTFDLEGTPGATIAATNLVLQGTGSAVYDAAMAGVGSTGAKFTNTAGNARTARITLANSKTYAHDEIFTLPDVLPAGAARITFFSFRRTLPAAGVIINLQVDSTGRVGYEAGTSGFIVSSGTHSAGAKVRCRLRIVVGVSTTDGTCNLRVDDPGSGWTVQSGTTKTQADAPGGVLNLGTTDVTFADFGMLSNPASSVVVGVDYARFEDGRTTDFSAPPTASPPTAAIVFGNSGADQYAEATALVSLASTGSVAGTGSLTGYLWTVTSTPHGATTPALSTPTASSTTLTPSVGGWYGIQLRVTQTGGLTDTEDVILYCHAKSADDVLIRDTVPGMWTSEGSPPAANPTAALNDPNPANYLQSPTNPAGEPCVIFPDPCGPGSISMLLSGNWTGGTVTRTAQWYAEDGITTLGVPEVYALTSVEVEHDCPMDSAGLAIATPGAGRRAVQLVVSDD